MNWEITLLTNVKDDSEGLPCLWTYRDKWIDIVVLNCHARYPCQWVMHCRRLGIDTMPLNIPNDSEPEQAQAAALEIVKGIALDWPESNILTS